MTKEKFLDKWIRIRDIEIPRLQREKPDGILLSAFGKICDMFGERVTKVSGYRRTKHNREVVEGIRKYTNTVVELARSKGDIAVPYQQATRLANRIIEAISNLDFKETDGKSKRT